MKALRKLERNRLEAEVASLSRMLEGLSERDVVMRLGIEDQLTELRAELGELEYAGGELASAALFFGGAPVIGNRGIESEFGSRAVSIFQDLVAKQFAHESVGLGQRGVVPNKGAARLHVTDVVRGSFGFVLEEIDSQTPMIDSALKDSVDHVSDLIAAFGEDDEERFQAAVSESDERVLSTAKTFFEHMRQAGATFRIVNGEKDRSLTVPAIARAENRATTTGVKDVEESIYGVFSSALPDGHQMEFRTEGPRGVIRGRVDRSYSSLAVVELNREWMERQAVGRFRVRKVLKDGSLVRESFTLLGLEATLQE
jgi:hypothetical protein